MDACTSHAAIRTAKGHTTAAGGGGAVKPLRATWSAAVVNFTVLLREAHQDGLCCSVREGVAAPASADDRSNAASAMLHRICFTRPTPAQPPWSNQGICCAPVDCMGLLTTYDTEINKNTVLSNTDILRGHAARAEVMMRSGTVNLPDSKPCWDVYDVDGCAWTGLHVCGGNGAPSVCECTDHQATQPRRYNAEAAEEERLKRQDKRSL